MIKMMATSRRRPGMTYAEFIEYNVMVHARSFREHPVQALKYVQSHVFDSCFGKTGDKEYQIDEGRDSVTEIYFEDMNALEATFSDPISIEKGLEDAINYVDTTNIISLLTIEEEIPVPNPGSGRLKVVHFLKRREDVSGTDFLIRWRSAHESAVEKISLAPFLRRVVLSTECPDGEEFAAQMGGTIHYDAVVSLWFDLVENGAKLFRSYIDAMSQCGDDPIDHTRSFFLFTNELVLFDFTRNP